MTRALVQDQDGFRYRGGAKGDPHVFTRKTEFGTTSAVNSVVDRELAEATASAANVAVVGEYVPRDSDPVPFSTGLELGDAVNAAGIDGVRSPHRIASWRISESAGGLVSASFELGSIVEDEVARQGRWLERATPGSLAGRADSVGSVQFGMPHAFRKEQTRVFCTANQTGYLLAELDPDDPEDEGRSDYVEVETPTLLFRLQWSLAQAGDTDTIVVMRVNDVPVHVIEIPAGVLSPGPGISSENGTYTNYAAEVGDRVNFATVQAGDYARGLVVKVLATSQA